MSPVMTLGRGAYALSNPYEVDGRVSWHARDLRGWSTANCYLFVEGRRALLADTGLTIHRDTLIAQLEELLAGVDELTVFTLRLGEFDSICNLLEVIERFDVRAMLGQYDDGPRWADIHPDQRLVAMPRARDAATRVPMRNDVFELAPGRRLEIVKPSLRLLSTHWIYDSATRMLVTSDSFGHAIAPDPDGPWLLDGDEVADDIGIDDVRAHLLQTRFWWLAGSHCEQLRRDLAAIFDRFDVETIGPAFGRILRGRALVARHVGLVDSVMTEIDAQRQEEAA
jgi:hypothetical protein